jgi:lipopolysaccharide export system permease protein
MTTQKDKARALWAAWRPTRIDRYLAAEVFFPFLGGIVLVSFLFIMFQVLRLAELFITHHAPLIVLLKMTGFMIVQVLPVAIPMAFLMAVIVACGRLSNDSEWVAMKACGLSVPRLTIPFAAMSLISIFASLLLNLEWVPWAERGSLATVNKLGNTTAVASIREGTFTTGFFGILIYAETVDRRTGQLTRVFIYDEREAGHPMTVVAARGYLVPIKTESELGNAVLLRLFDGSIHNHDSRNQSYQKTLFGEYKLYLKVDEGKETFVTKHKMLTWRELKEFHDVTPESSDVRRELKAEYWRRISLSLSPIIFVFLGIGMGSFQTRNLRAGAGLITVAVILLYWGAQTFAISISVQGTIPAWLAMEIPNLLLAALAITPYRRSTL